MSHAASGFALGYRRADGERIEVEEVDAWELKAARRGLLNLKKLLYGQSMLNLLQKQIEEADIYFKEIIAKSGGQYRESRFDLTATGLTKDQFLSWFGNWIKSLDDPDGKEGAFLDMMAPAHPEHYAFPLYPKGIIETIGGHIARIRLQTHVDLPEFARAYLDPAYQVLPPGIGTLEDGSILFYACPEVRDTEDGSDFRLRILFPKAAPQTLIDEHCEHLAIEFRSFIIQAFQSQQKPAA